MQITCYASFDPLLHQLQEYGKFSKRIPANTPGVKEISDYIFSELSTCIKQNRFPHSGTLFDINCHDFCRISISTVLTFNCRHVKSFLMSKSDFDYFLDYLDQVTRVYTHLFVERPRYDFQDISILYREEAS